MWNCLSNINFYENKLSKCLADGGEPIELDVDFKKICRTCLRDASDTNNLLSDFEIGAINFNFDGRVLRLIDMLAESTNIEVSDSDNFPHQVCNNCIQNISGAYFFRLQCYKANCLLQRLDAVLNKPIEYLESATNNSPISNSEIKQTFDKKCDIEKSISSFFIELFPENAEPTESAEPTPNDDETVDGAKEMSVEFDGVQYQIDSEILQVDTEEDENEENILFTEVDEENRLIQKDEEITLTEEDDVGDDQTLADQMSENIAEDEAKSNKPTLEEIKIEILESNGDNLEEREQTGTKNYKTRSAPQRKKQVNAQEEFKCEICGSKFTKVQSLKRHVKIHQADQRNKLCSFCGKAFIRADDLTRHIRTHTGERPYACKLCPKRYKQTSELNEHLLTHSREKKFVCSICGNVLLTRNGYYVHMLIHRGEKRHHCEKCGNRYVTSGELHSHIRHIHDKVKPYRCNIGDCERSFTTKHSFDIHQRSHTGEKPYKCLLCTKCFSAKSSLQDHLRTHMGVQAFKCNICDKSVTTYQALRKHLQTHEKDMENMEQYVAENYYVETIDCENSDTMRHDSDTMSNVIEEEEMYILENVCQSKLKSNTQYE